ncbi:MAG: DUF475 domain-containing protein [Frankiaceae bacterium]
MLRIFGWSFGITIAVLAGALIIGGGEVAALVGILAVLEISLSFDNAVVNATILRRMSMFWQKIFLTIGIVIAVFGMRFLFPIIIVAVTAHISPWEVFELALHHPSEYAEKLTAAHPSIAAFGGIFLWMIFLDFMLDPEREIHWLSWLERPLARIGKLEILSVVIALVSLLVVAEAFSGDHTQQVLTAGVAGLATYLGVRGLGEYFEQHGVGAEEDDGEEVAEAEQEARALVAAQLAPGKVEPLKPLKPLKPQPGGSGAGQLALAAGKAGFFLFLYLELIDASFSFDGVIGAFAITDRIFIIMAGLGVGAMYIRSLTVFLVRRGTLQEYVYLEHGAHWAIGALAVILAITIETEVPELVTGLVGVAFIGASFLSSLARRRRLAEEEGEDEDDDVDGAQPGDVAVGTSSGASGSSKGS